jgi:hypothetical protein
MEENKEKQPNTEKPAVETKTPEKSKESKVLEQTDEEKKEQERTTINKGLFLKHFADHRVADVVCKKIGIVFKTFWEWKKEDPEFADAVRKINEERNDAAEDILMGLVFIKHDPSSIRFYLKKQHPEYRDRSEVDMNINPAISMKQFIEAYEQRNDKPAGSGDAPANKGQEKQDGAVCEQPGTTDLLEKKDEEKPVVEAKAEGTK